MPCENVFTLGSSPISRLREQLKEISFSFIKQSR